MKYYGYAENVKRTDVFHMSHSTDLFEVTDDSNWYFFDLGNSTASGRTRFGKICYHTGYACSMRADIVEGRYLRVTAAPTLMEGVKCEDIWIDFEESSESPFFEVTDYGNGTKRLLADLYDDSYLNGFYRIRALFNNDMTTDVYLYVNCASDDPEDYEFYTCNGEKHYFYENFDPMSRNAMINELIESEGITPENALTASNHYPYCAPLDNDDSQYWINLSHEILRGYENTTLSRKALILHEWMTSNLKYDYYKANVLRLSRYYKYDEAGNLIVDPSQYVSQNYTGVCLDFSSIYAIMCRENEIPCVVLSNDEHAWNALYFGSYGHWIEADLTVDVNRVVNGEDMTQVEGDMLYNYSGFLTYKVNNSIPDTATMFCW